MPSSPTTDRTGTEAPSTKSKSRGWHHRVNNMLTVLTNHSELLLINLDREEFAKCRESAILMRERLFELDEYLRKVAAQVNAVEPD